MKSNLMLKLLSPLVFFFSLVSTAQSEIPKYYSPELAFWMQAVRSNAYARYELPNTVGIQILLGPLKQSDVEVRVLNELSKQLNGGNARSDIVVELKEDTRSKETLISVRKCSIACLETIDLFAASLKIRLIRGDTGNPLDLVKCKQFSYELRQRSNPNTDVNVTTAAIVDLLSTHPCAVFIKLNELDRLAIVKLMLTPEGHKIGKNGLMEDIVVMLSNPDPNVDSMMKGPSQQVIRIAEAKSVVEKLYRTVDASEIQPHETGYFTIKISMADEKTNRANYLKVPERLAPMQYLVLRNSIRRYNANLPAGANPITVTLSPNFRSDELPFIVK